MAEFFSIVTHNDFDGIGCAALLSWAYDIEEIRFAGPITIARAEIPITMEDIVSDLPYPLECGMWFDHHAGNLTELQLRGIDVQSIPGRFADAPSCVRVVHDFLLEEARGDLPEDYAVLADAADIIDSFSYRDIAAWRADTPENRIDRAIKSSSPNRRAHENFLREVVALLRDLSLVEAAEDSEVKRRAASYLQEEERMLDYLRRYGRLLPDPAAGDVFLVDTTGFSNPVRIDKKLIALIQPDARCYVELKPVFRDGIKTHDVAISLSLALSMQRQPHQKDMGEIMRLLNIGDGHPGAAAGVWQCHSVKENQRAREELAARILAHWSAQA